MGKHKKTYMILSDDSEEFVIAMRYAALSAKKKKANIAVLRVLQETDFQHWGNIEERMKAELRQQAEELMETVAHEIEAIHGERPKIIIEEGSKVEAIIRTIESDPIITKLILASSTDPSGPGPLIEYFAGKGIDELNVPLVIVPGHVTKEKIESLI